MAYYDTYRDQLTSLYHGHALWVPDPAGLYDHVRVGDVGIVRQGHFLRMFTRYFHTMTLPRDTVSQKDSFHLIWDHFRTSARPIYSKGSITQLQWR